MQGLHRGVIPAVLMAWCVTSYAGPRTLPDVYGNFRPGTANNPVIAERFRGRASAYDSSSQLTRFSEISSPGASFIKLHFSQFNLPEGVLVEISNPDGSEVWRYSAKEKDTFTLDQSLGDDGVNRFSAMSITGDTVHVRLLGNLSTFNPARHAIEIDTYMKGLPLGHSIEGVSGLDKFAGDEMSRTESVCGANELYDAACWASSNSWEYEYSAAVAKLINSRGEVCTAWRVGPDNLMFTAEHCLSKQSELDGSEIWFNYESTSCGGSKTTNAVKVTGGTLYTTSTSLDYALFSVSNFSAISSFPSFGLDVDTPAIGEPIFIPQHGLGKPRQIAIESDMNSSGECEVDALGLDGYAPGSDIGYYCDTTTSSSGAPVVSNISGRVVALHHAGGCTNQGVSMKQIWQSVSGFFNGKVPGSSSGGGSGGSDNQPPNAKFSYDCSDLSCAFNGSASSDADGSIVEFSWAFGDGKKGSGSNSSHEFSTEGDYAVTLTVKDNKGASASEAQTVHVFVPNEAPTAKFSTVCVDNQCEFNGAGSTDPDGEIVAWYWKLGDGTSGQGESFSHTYAKAGTFTVTLTVVDDKDETDDKIQTVNLVMPNEKPLADFSFSCDELECSFDAGSSSDPDGQITAWNWSFGDGGSSSGSLVSHNFTKKGSFNVSLTVSDNAGATGSRTRNVSVNQSAEQPNQAPSADFSFDCTFTVCEFNASTSRDPDGALVSWTWSFGDGSSSSGERPAHDFDSAGSYTVTLTVEDDQGTKDTRRQTVRVEARESNLVPEAQFTYECDELTCRFDASPSHDPDGNLISYHWSMGDGGSANDMNFEYRFTESGSFKVALTVEDNKGGTSTNSSRIKVNTSQPEIFLQGEGSRYNGRAMATLRWSGAESGDVELYRDGHLIALTANDGKHIDTEISNHRKSAAYRVCQPSSQDCSSTVVLNFGSETTGL